MYFFYLTQEFIYVIIQSCRIAKNLLFCTIKEKVMYNNSYFDKIYDRITNHFNEMSISEINEIYSQMNACPEEYKANALFIMGLLYIRHGVTGKGIENLKQASQLGNFMAVVELEKLNSNVEENAVHSAENVIVAEDDKQNDKPKHNSEVEEAMQIVECFEDAFEHYFPKEKMFSEGYNKEDVYFYILSFTNIINNIHEGKCTKEQASEEIYELNILKNFRSSKMGGLVKYNVDSNIAELDKLYELLTGEKPRQGFSTEIHLEGFLKKDVVEYIEALKFLINRYESGECTKEDFNYDLAVHRRFRKLRNVHSGGLNKNEVMNYINNLNDLADKLANDENVSPYEKPKKADVSQYLEVFENTLKIGNEKMAISIAKQRMKEKKEDAECVSHMFELTRKYNSNDVSNYYFGKLSEILANEMIKRDKKEMNRLIKEERIRLNDDSSGSVLRTTKGEGFIEEDVLAYLDFMNTLIENLHNGSISKEEALNQMNHEAPLLRTARYGQEAFVKDDVLEYINELTEVINNF